jgi:hypothetical protein
MVLVDHPGTENERRRQERPRTRVSCQLSPGRKTLRHQRKRGRPPMAWRGVLEGVSPFHVLLKQDNRPLNETGK